VRAHRYRWIAAAVSLITRESVRVYYVCGVISCWSTVVSYSRPAPRTSTADYNIATFRQSFGFVHLFRVCPVPIFRPRSFGDVFLRVPFSSTNVVGVLLLLLVLFFKQFFPPTIDVYPFGFWCTSTTSATRYRDAPRTLAVLIWCTIPSCRQQRPKTDTSDQQPLRLLPLSRPNYGREMCQDAGYRHSTCADETVCHLGSWSHTIQLCPQVIWPQQILSEMHHLAICKIL